MGYPAAPQTAKVVAADLNGDGIPDLVALGQGRALSSTSPRSRRSPSTPARSWSGSGLGDGTFGAAASYALSSAGPVNAVAVGDVNSDGIPDLVATVEVEDGVDVLLGNGDGTFQAPVFSSTGPSSSPLSPAPRSAT